MDVAAFVATLGLEVDKSQWRAGHEAVETLKRGLLTLVAIRAGEAVVGLVDGVAKLGEQATHLSQETGLSTEKVQELGYAAEVTGLSTEALVKGFVKAEKGLVDFVTTGKGKAGPAFEALGLSMAQLRVDAKDPEALIGQVADAFAKSADGPAKAKVAIDIFGRGLGVQLIPFLDRGSAGLKDLAKEAHETGYVLGKSATEDLTRYEMNSRRAGAAWQGFKNTLVTTALPILSDLMEGLVGWIRDNHDAIAAFADVLGGALATAGQIVGPILAGVGEAIKFLADHAELTQDLLVGLGVVLAAFAIQAAAAWAAALGPITLVIVAIAAVVAAIRFLIKHWFEVMAVVQRAADWINRKIRALIQPVIDVATEIIEWFEKVGEAIKQSIEDAIDWCIRKLKAFVHWMASGPLGKVLNALTGGGAGTAVAEQLDASLNGPPGAPASATAPATALPGSTTTNAPVAVQIQNNTQVDVHSNDPAEIKKHIGDHLDDLNRDAMNDFDKGRGKK